MKFRTLILILACGLLLACGGGSGGGNDSPAVANKWDEMRWDEGRWQ